MIFLNSLIYVYYTTKLYYMALTAIAAQNICCRLYYILFFLDPGEIHYGYTTAGDPWVMSDWQTHGVFVRHLDGITGT